MNLRPWRRSPTVVEERSVEPLSFDEWMSYFSFGGLSYLFGFQQTLTGDREEIGGDFTGLVRGAYKSNGVIFACMLVRQMLFSEARFAFRRFTDGRPGDLFGNTDLRVLERPGGRQSPSVTTGVGWGHGGARLHLPSGRPPFRYPAGRAGAVRGGAFRADP
jgi:hypothetical protein